LVFQRLLSFQPSFQGFLHTSQLGLDVIIQRNLNNMSMASKKSKKGNNKLVLPPHELKPGPKRRAAVNHNHRLRKLHADYDGGREEEDNFDYEGQNEADSLS
jgi:hypothetical protein